MSIGIEVGIALGTHTGLSGISTISTPATGVTGLFVDKTVAQSTTYDPDTRTIGSGDQPCYTTIQAAVDAMASGDDIYVRGAISGGTETYFENVSIKGTTHPDGTAGNYCSLQSYPGEWAEVDGQGLADYTIGKINNGRDNGNDLAYWKFERLGITGGCLTNQGAGLYISGGPFIVQYNDIHDNTCAGFSENPGGIVGYCWQDSVCRFNRFVNNGSTTPSLNSSHITIFTDFNWSSIAQNGYTGALDPVARNDWSYNNFNGANVGFKHKGGQLFTGRNPGTADFDDTFSTYGDRFHHNYFNGQIDIGLLAEQDFAQVYNNIFDNQQRIAISFNYQPDFQIYKTVTYNNTCQNTAFDAVARWGAKYFDGVFTENEEHYGWDLNNIIDSHNGNHNGWYTAYAFNVFAYSGGARTPYTSPGWSNYIGSNNYLYRQNISIIFKAYANPTIFTYTAAQYEVNTTTGSPKVVYANAFDGGNLLYVGTTGSDKYLTVGTHLIEAGVTVADGGTGGAHPYLAGVTIPSYVGAANPADNAWVDGVVIDIASTAFLKAQTGGTDPSWIEA